MTRPVPVARRTILGIATSVALLSAAAIATLWWFGTRGLNGEQLVSARFDALKIGLSIGAGGGGLFALYLAWLRQRSMEADLDNRERALAHQERIANHTRADATERRITELYTKGVEQLGSDKAPVRLGGLYALERLAQDNSAHRQTIVNVFCAYLRMPYVMPGVAPTTEAEDRERTQEREVRETAQRILREHLRGFAHQPSAKFWPETSIDLTGANLVDFDFSHCVVEKALFRSAVFTGVASFERSTFTRVASFVSARFTGDSIFRGTAFERGAFFGSTEFAASTSFESATFRRSAMFESAAFRDHATFTSVAFGPTTNFEGATFARRVPEEVARFVS